MQRQSLAADENAHLRVMIDPMMTHVIPYLANQGDDTKSNRDLSSVAISCRLFNNLVQSELTKRAVKKLLQAVIDDKVEIVKTMLDKNPALLFMALDKDLVIESSYTWQRFNMKNTNALKVAAKRKQLGMVELLLSYCDKLEQTDEIKAEKANALSAWTPYQIATNTQGVEEIVIPSAYEECFLLLIEDFVAETFPHGTGTPDDPNYTHLSNETEATLSFFFNGLFPKNAVPLDEYVDVELLLLAAYKAYKAYLDNFDAFHNWEQRDAYCIRVIGLIQTALPPEMGKIFCEGFYCMVTNKNRKISERAQALLLEGDYPFYRSSRESRSVTGFKYAGVAARLLQTMCKLKTRSFWELCSKHCISTTCTPCSMNRRAV